ncbi:lipid A export permease/ATP-binding protein MsbA [Legionella sp. W05-934-2]|jgi:subfamily B ATP-binding cassette protein MsbA|uniref:lipid A export permease/ATP-binding protein MsbA n=1 Tax=Legionella sp. W05-934-2 TaxID=1198649 RepID=UPI0034632571
MTKREHRNTTYLYRRLFTFIKPFWPVLVLGIFANIAYAGIDAGFTYLMKPFMDKGFIDVDMTFVHYIPWIVLIGITSRGILSALGGYCMTWVARSVVKALRHHVFTQVVRLPADYYDQSTSGQLLSKILYDVEQVAKVSADALTDLVQNGCLVIGLFAVMFIICWQLALMFVITVPFVGIIVNITNKRIRRVSHRLQKTMGHVTEIASEAIEGYQVVRVFGGEDYEINKFNQANEHSRIQDMKVAMSKAINTSGVQIIIAIGIALIVTASIQLSTVITITAGSFLAVIAAMLQLIKPLKTLSSISAVIQRGLAGAESVFELLDSPIENQSGDYFPHAIKGDICFENVSYAYRNGPRVLNDINLSIKAGQTVALVGHSGSGKTTLASLIPRFYQVAEGKISIDGHDINRISLRSLRQQLSLVSQHVTLFNDTLANNIAYANADASRTAIIAAAKMAYAHDFISELPNGYDTLVGENGLLLSGGQRQRLAIARAILKDSPILILDEATSALDSESEKYIQKALEKIMQNRTTIVIAHRLSTIQQADNIVVMHKGQIVEQGTHEQLLKFNGYYKKLILNQDKLSTSVNELSNELEKA